MYLFVFDIFVARTYFISFSCHGNIYMNKK